MFWSIWGIGWIVVLITILSKKKWMNQYDESKVIRVGLIGLVMLCIFLVGGTTAGMWLGTVVRETQFANLSVVGIMFNIMVLVIVPLLVVYCVGYAVLWLFSFERIGVQISFIIVFILSVAFWTKQVYQYEQNKEEITRTMEGEKTQRELLYFCNIPVQHVSETIRWGKYSDTVDIQTQDNLSYWYLNENGEGVYDSAVAANSKIIFLEEDEEPYVEIIPQTMQKVILNRNNGKEEIESSSTWNEYRFYLPKEIMQYNLN